MTILKYDLTQHTADQYIPINPLKPQIGFFPKEESQMMSSREYDYLYGTNTGQLYESENVTTTGQATLSRDTWRNNQSNPSAIAGNYPLNSYYAPTDYMGAITMLLPYNINPNFSDFKLFDPQINVFTGLNSTGVISPDSLTTDFYNSADNKKLIDMFTGLQGLRIPANKFNIVLSDPILIAQNGGNPMQPKYGKYYIKITPKYVETTIQNYDRRRHQNWQNFVVQGGNDGRRSVISFDNLPFKGTLWGFENSPVTNLSQQRGRLFGSVVELWNSSKTILKGQKYIAENGFEFNNPFGILVMYPDNMGYDAATAAPNIGDVLRIYPRETYFQPMYIEVNYASQNVNIDAVVRYIGNDVSRNLTSGVIEVYDSNGITVETDGTISGTVIDAYQIFQAGNTEIRKKLSL